MKNGRKKNLKKQTIHLKMDIKIRGHHDMGKMTLILDFQQTYLLTWYF